jgi:fumarate reductase flavoprotein subunit
MDTMWNDVGVIRNRPGLDRALAALDEIEAELQTTGVADGSRSFNLSWHDWLNLRSLIEISRVITLAARWRENSRGAHFREDFCEPGDLDSSTFGVARQKKEGRLEIETHPVQFTIVRPGETLLSGKAAAE